MAPIDRAADVVPQSIPTDSTDVSVPKSTLDAGVAPLDANSGSMAEALQNVLAVHKREIAGSHSEMETHKKKICELEETVTRLTTSNKSLTEEHAARKVELARLSQESPRQLAALEDATKQAADFKSKYEKLRDEGAESEKKKEVMIRSQYTKVRDEILEARQKLLNLQMENENLQMVISEWQSGLRSKDGE